MKLTPLITCLCIATSLATNAATVNFNLGGLWNPTGSETNGGDTRQFAYTTVGGELTITYTLDISMASPTSLANAFQYDNLFRRPGSGVVQLPTSGGNMVAGESLTITLDSIVANTGWTLNSLTKSNTVGISGDGRVGTELATFTVNGVAFTTSSGDIGTTASGLSTITNSGFADFNAAGESLLFETTAGNTGKLNLQGLGFAADVTAVPEPSSTALLGLGGFALILRRRR